MKSIILSLFFISLFTTAALADAQIVRHQATDVCIYHSGARVNRSTDTKLTSGTHVLYFENISSKIVLNSLSIKNKDITILNRKIKHKTSEENLLRLQDELLARQNSLKLLDTKFNDPEFVKKQEELPAMLEYYTNQSTNLKRRIREIEKAITEAEKLSEFQLDNESVCILEVSLNVSKDMTEPLRLSYVTGGIGWSPYYEINIESSSDNKMHVRYMARMMSQTGETWERVNVNVSSAFPLDVPTTLPEAQSHWVVENTNTYDNASNIMRFNYQREQNELQIERLAGVAYQEINAPGFLESIEINGKHTIESNNTVIALPVKELNIPAKYYHYCYPSIETQAYLVADIYAWGNEQFVDGMAGIVYEGNDLGTTMLRFSQENDTLMLPVGKDNKVFVDYKEVADEKEIKDISFSKKKRLKQTFKLTVKNNHDHSINMLMKEQIPISQSSETEVELLEISGGTHISESGEIHWKLKIGAGENIEKRLSLEIISETERNFKKRSHRSSVRTMACPSF